MPFYLGAQSFQASLADPSGESSGRQGGFDEKRDCRVEEIEVPCHDTSFKTSETDENQSKRYYSLGGYKMQAQSPRL